MGKRWHSCQFRDAGTDRGYGGSEAARADTRRAANDCSWCAAGSYGDKARRRSSCSILGLAMGRFYQWCCDPGRWRLECERGQWLGLSVAIVVNTRSMSAIGPKQTWAFALQMSALRTSHPFYAPRTGWIVRPTAYPV